MASFQSDRPVILVGGLVGASVGLFAVLVLSVSGPETIPSPVHYQISYSYPPRPGGQAVMDVQVLGIWEYRRTAADPSAFDAERTAFSLAPRIAFVVLGLAVGLVGARLFCGLCRKR